MPPPPPPLPRNDILSEIETRCGRSNEIYVEKGCLEGRKDLGTKEAKGL